MRTVYGYDFRGEICATGQLEAKRFMYYPNPPNLDFSLCISACPYYYVRDYFCIYGTDHSHCLSDYPNYSSIESTVLSFYCVPWKDPGRAAVLEWLYSPMWVLKRAAGDLILAWTGVLIGLIVAALVGFGHLMLFRSRKTVKYTTVSIILSLALLALLSFLFLKNYSEVPFYVVNKAALWCLRSSFTLEMLFRSLSSLYFSMLCPGTAHSFPHQAAL